MKINFYLFVTGVVFVKIATGQEAVPKKDTINLQLYLKPQSELFYIPHSTRLEPELKLLPGDKWKFPDHYEPNIFYKKNSFFNKLRPYYVPVTLLAFSLYSVSDNAAEDSPFDKYSFQKDIHKILDFRSNIDNYLQYAPLAITGGLKLAGIKGRSDGINTAILAAKAHLLTGLIVTNLKRTTGMLRPDNSSYTSFPSGHTATAFCNATIMHMEMKDESIWYSIAAYSMASATGIMRIVNNNHWLPDVLAGAAIGIATTRLVYATHRYRWRKKPSNLVIVPRYSNQTAGLYLSYKF